MALITYPGQIIRHDVRIVDKKVQYVACLKDAVVYLTVPRATWHGGMMHLVTRSEQIDDIQQVWQIMQYMLDRKKVEAWRHIGGIIHDVYLKGLRND
jgi:hypothetical protein